MLAVFTSWDWTEIAEGFVGTTIICGWSYVLHRIRVAMHERHHVEIMKAHADAAEERQRHHKEAMAR